MMDGQEFWTRVHADKRLEWLGCLKVGEPEPTVLQPRLTAPVLTKDTVYVRGPRYSFALLVETILEEEWTTLLAVFVGERPPQVLQHFCRIVGYYSYMKSWNKSKLAEMADRRKGAEYIFGGRKQGKTLALSGSPLRMKRTDVSVLNGSDG